MSKPALNSSAACCRTMLVELLASPARPWLQACRHLRSDRAALPTEALAWTGVRPPASFPWALRSLLTCGCAETKDRLHWLDLRPDLPAVLKLHVACLAYSMNVQQDGKPPPDLPDAVARAFARDLALPDPVVMSARDLYAEIAFGSPRPALRRSSIRILVVPTNQPEARGELLRLVAERVPAKAGVGITRRIYPAPSTLPVAVDAAWTADLEAAREFVSGHWPAGEDVRWSLETQNGRSLTGLELGGPSAGAAWRLLLAHLFEIPPYAGLDLMELAITAGTRDGHLTRVGDEIKKILAAVDGAYPSLLRLGLAQDQFAAQDAASLGLASLHSAEDHGQIWHDRNRPNLHLLLARDLPAFAQLCQSQVERDRSILACRPKEPEQLPKHHVRMGFLHDAVEQFLLGNESGYYEVVGLAGFGKTTFVKALLEDQRRADPSNPPVFYFTSLRGTDTPADVARSFYRQLGLKYALDLRPDLEGLSPRELGEALRARLDAVSACLLRPSGGAGPASPAEAAGEPRREVLYLDAPDQMPEPAQLLPGLLDKLPPRVFMIIATRPDRRWRGFHDVMGQAITNEVPVPDARTVEPYCAAVKEFLLAANGQLHLPLDLIDRICRADNPDEFPVFKTVAMYVGLLQRATRADDAALRAELRVRPERWRIPWEATLLETILPLAESAAARRGVAAADFRTFLGVCWAAQEALSVAELESLQLCPAERVPVMLEAAANLFRPPGRRVPPADRTLEFNHAGNRRALESWLTARERDRAHSQLAAACAVEWQDEKSAVRGYALRHAFAHLMAAGDTTRAADLLLQPPFLQARLGADECRWPTGQAPDPVYRVLSDMAACLRALPSDPRREPLTSLHLALLRSSHLLAAAGEKIPSLLLQELHNNLAAEEADDAPLLQDVRRAAAKLNRPWIERRTLGADTASPRALTTMLAHEAVTALAWDPKRKDRIAAGYRDGTLQFWNPLTGEPYGPPLPTGHGEITALAYSPDGILATGGKDGTIRRWAADGLSLGPPLTGHTDKIRALAYSPDGILATGGEAGTIRRWAADGQPLGPLRMGSSTRLTALAYAPDGTLASAGADGTIRRWAAADGRPLVPPLSWHQGFASSVAHLCLRLLLGMRSDSEISALAYSPDGLLASGGRAGEIRRWAVLDCRKLNPLLTGQKGWITALAYSPDGTLATAGEDGTICRWTADGCQLGFPLTGHTRWISALAYSPDGTLVSASADKSIRRWGKAEARLLGPRRKGFAGLVFFVSRFCRQLRDRSDRFGPYRASAQAFSSDGTLASAGGCDREIRRWTADGRPLGPALAGHSDPIKALAYSPDGTLASADWRGTIRRWTADGRPLGPALAGHSRPIEALAYSPDGTLASADWCGTIRRWTAAGSPLGPQLSGSPRGITALAFSRGGVLASAGYDLAIRLWMATGKPKGPLLTGHSDNILALAFSPTGTLVSAGQDRTLRLWAVASGQPMGPPLLGHQEWITVLAFSHVGTLASADKSGGIRVWITDPDRYLRCVATITLDGSVYALRFDPHNSRRLWVGLVEGNTIVHIIHLTLHNLPNERKRRGLICGPG